MRILYVSLLVLGFTSGISMQTCPSEEDISPCKCYQEKSGEIEVDCYKSADLKTIKGALSSVYGKNIGKLYLGDLKELVNLTSDFFYGLRIKKLEISNCPLDNIQDDDTLGFLGLENYLKELTIDNSFTKYNVRRKFNFGHLKKLKGLYLSGNRITEIDDDWFSNGTSSLEILILKRNLIYKIGNNAFSQLNNLNELHLTGNYIDTIKRSMLPSAADRLEILNLYANRLSYLPEDIFSKMPSISRINLKANKLNTIDERTFSPIWQQLNELQLTGNEIRCDRRLNWIFQSKKRPYVSGSCKSPEQFKGKTLEQFFKSREQ